MEVKNICPKCGAEYHLEYSMVGTKVECKCGEKWIVKVPNSTYSDNVNGTCATEFQEHFEKETVVTKQTLHVSPSGKYTMPLGEKIKTLLGYSLVLVFAGLICWGFVSCVSSCNESDKVQKAEEYKYGKDSFARSMVVDAVRKQLKAPSTATIKVEGSVFDKETMIYSISGYVDAQNSFGAMIRSKFAAMVLYVPSKGYKVTFLHIQ